MLMLLFSLCDCYMSTFTIHSFMFSTPHLCYCCAISLPNFAVDMNALSVGTKPLLFCSFKLPGSLIHSCFDLRKLLNRIESREWTKNIKVDSCNYDNDRRWNYMRDCVSTPTYDIFPILLPQPHTIIDDHI